MITKLSLIAASVLALAFAGSASAASSVASITNTLSASPVNAVGPCPQVVTFKGTIELRGAIDPQAPVQIGYQFLRSDGAIGPIKYYMVTAPGVQVVSETWTLGGPPLPTYKGWQQLKAWPTRHEGGFGYAFSPKAYFRVVCRR